MADRWLKHNATVKGEIGSQGVIHCRRDFSGRECMCEVSLRCQRFFSAQTFADDAKRIDGIIESNCGRKKSMEIVLCVKQMKSRNKQTGRIKKAIMRMP